MITIQTSPLRRSFALASFSSFALGFVVFAIVGRFVDAEGWWPFLVLGSALASYLGLELLVGALYRPFAVDLAAGTARIGRRTVPISSIREAWRSVSAGANGTAYLIYRFRSDEGPVVRVLVAGRPLAGLTEEGRAGLVAFLERAPIPGPATASADDLASNVLGDGGRVPVSAASLLAELGPQPAPTPDQPPLPVDDATLAAMQADDEAALAALPAARPLGTIRRVTGYAFAVSVALVVVLGLLALALGAAGSLDGDVPGIVAGLVAALVTVTGLGWAILADLDARHWQSAGRRWMDSADAAARARGLPTPLQPAWLLYPPGHRILTLLAFTGAVIGMLLAIAGPVTFAQGETALGVLTLPGIVLLALALWFWVRHRRRRRADVAWVIDAAGPRVG